MSDTSKPACERLENYILSIPDFPEPGVIFRDITPIIESSDGMETAVEAMSEIIRAHDIQFDKVVGVEARGFIFSTLCAYAFGAPLALARKQGKLPRETVAIDYDLEYGSGGILEMHTDSIRAGEKVLLVDDLIATGGTLMAAAELVSMLGGEVSAVVTLIELAGLNGRAKLSSLPVYSGLCYDGK